MVDQINHANLAESRLATQFREATNLINYIRSLVREDDDLEQVFQDLLNERYIDTAIGAQLDVLGIIVGQERGFKQTVSETFFGFKGAIGGDTFGTIGDSGVGSNFRSISSIEFADVIFDDDTYRLFIRAKIDKNKSRGTIEETINIALQGITSSTTVVVTEGLAEFTLTFGGSLSDEDKLLLARTNYIPNPAGVSFAVADADGPFF